MAVRKYVPLAIVPPSAGGGVFAITYVAVTSEAPLARALHEVRASLFVSVGASDVWWSVALSRRACVSVAASVAESIAAPSRVPSSLDEEEEQLIVAAMANVTRAKVLESKKFVLMPPNVVGGADRVESAPKARRATKPSYGAKQRLLESKSQRSDIKVSRGRVGE